MVFFFSFFHIFEVIYSSCKGYGRLTHTNLETDTRNFLQNLLGQTHVYYRVVSTFTVVALFFINFREQERVFLQFTSKFTSEFMHVLVAPQTGPQQQCVCVCVLKV